MFITEFSDGTVIEYLAFHCSYNNKDRMVGFWCGERSRLLQVIKVLKDSKEAFQFIDGNGYTVTLSAVTIDDYRKYRDSLFINAPTLNTDDGIHGWLTNNS